MVYGQVNFGARLVVSQAVANIAVNGYRLAKHCAGLPITLDGAKKNSLIHIYCLRRLI